MGARLASNLTLAAYSAGHRPLGAGVERVGAMLEGKSSLEDIQAELAVNSGKATPEQISEARGLLDKRRKLGTDMDLLGALCEMKLLSEKEAEDFRKLASSRYSAQGGGREAPTIVPAEEVEPLPQERQPAAAAPSKGSGPESSQPSCYRHSDRLAVVACAHCGRPICRLCIVKLGKAFYCGEQCVAASRAAREASQGKGRFASVWKLGLACIALLVLLGIGWLVKRAVDDYRYTFAVQRAEAKGVDAKEAIEAYRLALRLKPQDVPTRVKLGSALLAAGDAKLAIEELNKVLAKEPLNAEALLALKGAYLAKGDLRAASDALARLRDAKAATPQTERELGILLGQLGLHQEAIDAFRNSLKLGPEWRDVRYRLACELVDLGRLEDAERELERAASPLGKDESGPEAARERAFLADASSMAKVYELLSDVAEKRKDAAAALAHAERAQRLDLGRLNAVKRRVRLLKDAGRLEEALKAAEESRAALGGNAEYLEIVAALQESCGAGVESLKTLRELYAIAPGRPGVLKRLLQAEIAFGQADRALAILRELPQEKKSDQEFVDVWVELVDAKLGSGDASGAEALLKDLAEYVERDPRFLTCRCEVLYRRGRIEEAVSCADRAIKQFPDRPQPHLAAARTYRWASRLKDALEELTVASRLGAGPETDLEMGLIFWEAGFREEAEKKLSVAESGLSGRKKDIARLYLRRLKGSEVDLLELSPAGSFVLEAMKLRSADQAEAMWQLHVGSAGLALAFSNISGDAEGSPADALESLRRVSYQTSDLDKPQVFAGFRKELDRAVNACARALRVLEPRASSSRIDKILEEYSASAGGTVFAQMASAAKAQVMLLAEWLSSGPYRDKLKLQVELALSRLRARLAGSSGELQAVACFDAALVEMFAAAIPVGPEGFMFGRAVEAVLAELAAKDSSSVDPLEQLCATRAAAFKMVWLLSRQVLSGKGR